MKNLEAKVVIKSTLGGAVNNYLKSVKDIRIQCYPETEIVEYDSDVKNIVIDTLSSTFSKTRSGLAKAERKVTLCNNSIRDRVAVGVTKAGDSITLATLAGLAKHILANNITEFDGYDGLAINHMDLSGNENTRGFTNNRLYNLELCTSYQNDMHNLCLRNLEKLYPEHRFAISANDNELIDVLRFGANADNESAKEFRDKHMGYRFMHDDYKRQYMDSIAWTGEIDKYGTIYIGNAGLQLKQWKELWKKQLDFEEIMKVRCL